MNKKNEIPNFLIAAKVIRKETARMAASEAVKFFKESFVKQGFLDESLTPWKKTQNPLAGKRTMYKSGVLMQSVRKAEESESRVIVESDTDHSQIHNEGGEIVVTEKMKSFFWAKYYEFAGKTKTTRQGTQSQSQANRRNNAKAEFCKRMALMKVGTKIKIPQRQFIGNSRTLNTQLESGYFKLVQDEMNKAFKGLK